MRRLRVHRDIAAPVAEVWDLLIRVERWPEWGPSVRSVQLDGPCIAAGSRGRVWTVAGLGLPFEVTEFEDGRSWAWRVGGVPATGHEVEPVPGGCRVTFSVPVPAAAYLGVCAVALRRIDRLATTPADR
jgi:hypothetical protein